MLSIGIGRGHPFYSDGLTRAVASLSSPGDVILEDVFQVARGLELAGWKGLRFGYGLAARKPGREAAYAGVRSWAASEGGRRIARLLGRRLRRWAGAAEVCVVDHPILVQALGDHPQLWYMHGESGVPPEAVVRGSHRTLVPTEDAARRFAELGAAPDSVCVTGLCIESELVVSSADRARERRRRFAGKAPLCVGAFSSGAEPRSHVDALVAGVRSLSASGHRVLVFACRGGRLDRQVVSSPGVDWVRFEGRAELDQRTVEHFAAFDAVLSPAHERSNWALGLGLPFVLVGPDIGPFPPRNREILEAAGVSRSVDSVSEAGQLGERLRAWRASGELEAMSRAGEGRVIEGFRVAAEAVVHGAHASSSRRRG